MSEQTFPFDAWELRSNFTPKKVTVVSEYKSVFDDSANFYLTDTSRYLFKTEVFATREEAIAFGWRKVAAAEADIQKRGERLAKKAANLRKAEAQEQPA